MFFAKWQQKRREAKRFAYFRLSVLADIDYLMGFPGDERFIRQLCQKYPATVTIIEEDFRRDASVQLAGLAGSRANGTDAPDGPRRRQVTQKTVAVNLVSGILTQELSKLSG